MDWAPWSARSVQWGKDWTGAGLAWVSQVSPPLIPLRLRYHLHQCVPPPLNLEWARSRGSKRPEIQNSFTDRGFLSTLPCVPLTLPCVGAAWELCAPALSLTRDEVPSRGEAGGGHRVRPAASPWQQPSPRSQARDHCQQPGCFLLLSCSL